MALFRRSWEHLPGSREERVDGIWLPKPYVVVFVQTVVQSRPAGATYWLPAYRRDMRHSSARVPHWIFFLDPSIGPLPCLRPYQIEWCYLGQEHSSQRRRSSQRWLTASRMKPALAAD